MIIWHPCTYAEFLSAQQELYDSKDSLVLLTYEHLGDEEEPMELIVWGSGTTKLPVLRSALTVNSNLYWRAQ